MNPMQEARVSYEYHKFIAKHESLDSLGRENSNRGSTDSLFLHSFSCMKICITHRSMKDKLKSEYLGCGGMQRVTPPETTKTSPNQSILDVAVCSAHDTHGQEEWADFRIEQKLHDASFKTP